jgi:hypothetical protein
MCEVTAFTQCNNKEILDGWCSGGKIEVCYFLTPIFNFSVDCPNKDMLLSPFETIMFFATAFHIAAIAIQWLFINKMNGGKKKKKN